MGLFIFPEKKMARVDDYVNAKKLAAEALSRESARVVGQRTGFELINDDTLRVPFLDQVYRVAFPGMQFTRENPEETRDIPLQEQVLILHYMMGDTPEFLSGKWVSYREIPGASFYYSAFVKRAVNPLKSVFGQNISGFRQVAARLNGKKVEPGDAAFEFDVFPKVPLQLIIWEGDEEFPSEANILFDAGIGACLSPEDIAWLSGMLVYRLMALSR